MLVVLWPFYEQIVVRPLPSVQQVRPMFKLVINGELTLIRELFAPPSFRRSAFPSETASVRPLTSYLGGVNG